jgi:hypothetical protein
LQELASAFPVANSTDDSVQRQLSKLNRWRPDEDVVLVRCWPLNSARVVSRCPVVEGAISIEENVVEDMRSLHKLESEGLPLVHVEMHRLKRCGLELGIQGEVVRYPSLFGIGNATSHSFVEQFRLLSDQVEHQTSHNEPPNHGI